MPWLNPDPFADSPASRALFPTVDGGADVADTLEAT
jgi:hypothetical protein